MYLTEEQLAAIIADAVKAALAAQNAAQEPAEADLEAEDKLAKDEYIRVIGSRERVCRPAKRADGTQRHTTDGRFIHEVCYDVQYPWGWLKTAPVILNGKEVELPLSLSGALFVDCGNGVAVELQGHSWRENFHPCAYKDTVYGVLKIGMEHEYGKLPQDPPVVDTKPKQAVKGAVGSR